MAAGTRSEGTCRLLKLRERVCADGRALPEDGPCERACVGSHDYALDSHEGRVLHHGLVGLCHGVLQQLLPELSLDCSLPVYLALMTMPQ